MLREYLPAVPPWVSVKNLAETAVLTRASLSVLIIVPVLNAVWDLIPELLSVSGLVSTTLPSAWVLLYIAALIVALNQAIYQVSAPGLVREYSLQEYVTGRLDSFRSAPDLDLLKKHALDQTLPINRQNRKRILQDIVFLAGCSDDQNYLDRYFTKFDIDGPRTDFKTAAKTIEWNYQRAIAITNRVMPNIYQREYEIAASRRRHLAHSLAGGYYLSILLIIWVVVDQSFEVFGSQFPGFT